MKAFNALNSYVIYKYVVRENILELLELDSVLDVLQDYGQTPLGIVALDNEAIQLLTIIF